VRLNVEEVLSCNLLPSISSKFVDTLVVASAESAVVLVDFVEIFFEDVESVLILGRINV